MKIGMNLLLYTTQPDEGIFPTCEKLKRMGYDGLEWPVFGTDVAMAEKIRKFNSDQGLGATTVYAFGPGMNPISPNQAERQAAMDNLKSRIEVTAALGADKICGPITQTLGHFTGAPPTPQERTLAVEFLREAGEFAQQHGVTLVVEYLNRFEIYFLNTAADACSLCDEIAHPNVHSMIDSFHANIEERNLRDAVHAISPHLVHVHVSENNRGTPGSSKCIQWEDYFGGLKEVGYDGWLTIEAFGQALPDLAAAAKIWRPLFESDEQLCRDGIAFIKHMWSGEPLPPT